MRKILDPIIIGNSILNFCYLYFCYTIIKDLVVINYGDKFLLAAIYSAFLIAILFSCIYLLLKVSMRVLKNKYVNLAVYQLIASLFTFIITVIFMYVIFNENSLSSYKIYALIVSFIIISYLIYSIIFLRYTENKSL